MLGMLRAATVSSYNIDIPSVMFSAGQSSKSTSTTSTSSTLDILIFVTINLFHEFSTTSMCATLMSFFKFAIVSFKVASSIKCYCLGLEGISLGN